MVFAPSAGLSGHRLYRGFNVTQAIAVRVIPLGIQDHRSCKQLRTGQHPLAALYGEFVLGQAPACIEGLPEHPWFMACENRLEPHLRRDGINAHGPFEQRPRADRGGQQGDAVIGVFGAKVARAKARRGFGVGLDDDPRAGVFLLCKDKHFEKPRPVRPRRRDRGVPKSLVDHQHISRIGGGVGWIKAAVFGQMRFGYPVDGTAGAVEQSCIIERMRGQDLFEVRGLFGVKVQPFMVYQ